MRVIGFGCTAQVGKDTAAEYLESLDPGKIVRVGFADKLKETAVSIFGLTQGQCYGSNSTKEAIDPRYGISPREIMQGLGEKMREIYSNIWVDTVFNTTIPNLESQGYELFIISDVRYPNEAEGISSRGGHVIKVVREGVGVVAGKNHSSETAMQDYQDFDFILDNNGTRAQYYEKIDLMMEDLGYDGTQRQSRYRRERLRSQLGGR